MFYIEKFTERAANNVRVGAENTQKVSLRIISCAHYCILYRVLF